MKDYMKLLIVIAVAIVLSLFSCGVEPPKEDIEVYVYSVGKDTYVNARKDTMRLQTVLESPSPTKIELEVQKLLLELKD